MRFTNLSSFWTLFIIGVLLQGCQVLDHDMKDKSKQQVSEPLIKLTPMQKIHQSENLYLTNAPIVSPKIQLQFDDAKRLIDKKQWQLAKDILVAITIAAPTLSGPWLMLGDVSIANNEQEHAIGHYRQAIYVNEYNYVSRNRLGALLRQSGDFKGAQEQYEQAINAWPAYTLARRNLGILLDLYVDKKQQALTQYQIVSALNALNNEKEDRQLKGWISDLSRRVKAAERAKQKNAEQQLLSDPKHGSVVNKVVQPLIQGNINE